MSMMQDLEYQCCVCEKSSTHKVIESTNTSGEPDLDNRPAMMYRSTILYWVQHCPHCGYCAHRISTCNDSSKKMVKSKKYQDIVNNTDFPEKASYFLALSYEYELLHNFTQSALHTIYAAWICDDENRYEESVKCRKEAIRKIEKANYDLGGFTQNKIETKVLIVDLMRRASMFKNALELLEGIKKEDLEEIIILILNYQERLIKEGDIASHTLYESVTKEMKSKKRYLIKDSFFETILTLLKKYWKKT